MAPTASQIAQGWVPSGGTVVQYGVDMGYCKDGARLTPSVDLYTVGESVEQLTLPVTAFRVSEHWEMSFTTIEPKLAATTNTVLYVVYDMANTPHAEVTPNRIDAELGTNKFVPGVSALLMYPQSPVGVPGTGRRTILVAEAVVSAPPEMVFTKTEEVALNVTLELYFSELVGKVGNYSDVV